MLRGYSEIMFPIIQQEETFFRVEENARNLKSTSIGIENLKMMYRFQDQGGRNLCLAPEYTAIIMQMAKTTYKFQKDVKLFYVAECFRGEKPQMGRYRQFTQFGVEIINPTQDYMLELKSLASRLIKSVTKQINVNTDVKRGLDYYTDGTGFEIEYPLLGAQKQICGGGEYPGGIGFAIGIDRLMACDIENDNLNNFLVNLAE